MFTSQIEKYIDNIQKFFSDITIPLKNKIRGFESNAPKIKCDNCILFFLKFFKTSVWSSIILFLSYVTYIIFFYNMSISLKIISGLIYFIAMSNLIVKIIIIWLEK